MRRVADGDYVPVELARQLERELAEAHRTNMALADMLCEAQGAVKSMERELVVAKKNTARLEHLIRRTSPRQFAKIVCYRLMADSIAAIDAAMKLTKEENEN